MRIRLLGLLAALPLAASAASPDVPAGPLVDPAALAGTWTADLRPTPDAQPYLQEFVVERVECGTCAGRFYGTPFEDGRLNPDWGALHFAFSTADGQTGYHTAGVLEDGRMRRSTHAVERGLQSVWTAVRAR